MGSACISKPFNPINKRELISFQPTRTKSRVAEMEPKSIQKLYEKFRVVAPNFHQKGGIDLKEFKKLFEGLRGFPNSFIESSFRYFDRGNTGFISFDELCDATSIIFKSSLAEKIRIIFDLYDVTGSGKLAETELRALLYTMQNAGEMNKREGAKWSSEMKEILLPRNSKKKEVDFEQFSAWAQKNLNVYALIAPFEIIPTPVRERNIIAGLLNNISPPQEGQTYYVLSSHWWRKWYTYVTLLKEVQDHQNHVKEVAKHIKEEDKHLVRTWQKEFVKINEDIIFQNQRQLFGDESKEQRDGDLDSHHELQESMQASQLMEQKALRRLSQRMSQPMMRKDKSLTPMIEDLKDEDLEPEEENAYAASLNVLKNAAEKPGQIDNSDIEGEIKGQLRKGLRSQVEFVVLPASVWNQFMNWYGGGPEFERRVHNNKAGQPRMELYPLLVNIRLSSATGRPLPNSLRKIQLSTFETVASSIPLIAALYEFRPQQKHKFRLWHKRSNNNYCLLESEEKDGERLTLEDLNIMDGDFLLLEVQLLNKQWPMDCLDNKEVAARRDVVELGDLFDVYDIRSKKWKVGKIVKIFLKTGEVKIHFEGESYTKDRIIEFERSTFATLGVHTVDARITREVLNKGIEEESSAKFVKGLRNLGNTCFMNAIFQCLANTPFLFDLFQHFSKRRHPKPQIKYSLANFLTKYRDPKETILQPLQLKRYIDSCIKDFRGYDQHDAHQFIALFLDELSEEMTGKKKALKQPMKSAIGTLSYSHSASPSILQGQVNQMGRSPRPYINNSLSHRELGINNDNTLEKEVRETVKRIRDSKKSAINQLFYGVTRNEIVCERCNSLYTNYQPFCFLSIPVPTPEARPIYFRFVPRIQDGKAVREVIHYAVRCNHFAKVEEFVQRAKALVKINQNHRLILAQLFNGKLEKIFQNKALKSYLRMLDHDSEFYLFEVLSLKYAKEAEDGKKAIRGRISSAPRSRHPQNGKRENSSTHHHRKLNSLSHASSQYHLDSVRNQELMDLLPISEYIAKGFDKIDYQDFKQVWRRAVIIEREKSIKNYRKIARIRIRIHHSRSRYPEWVTLRENQKYISPLGTHTKIPEPRMIYFQIVMREAHSPKLTTKTSHFTRFKPLGFPMVISVGSWSTWSKVYEQIQLQIRRFLLSYRSAHRFAETQYTEKFYKRRLSRAQNLENNNSLRDGTTSTKHINNSLDLLDRPGTNSDGEAINNMYLGESHNSPICAICYLFSLKYNCTGCQKSALLKLKEDERSRDIEWICGFLEKPTIIVEWNARYYQDTAESRDVSYLQASLSDQEMKRGIKLHDCLDSFTKTEELDDYECESCKKKGKARLKVEIASLPPILIIHLKRFSFLDGHMQKIEDLVTQKFISSPQEGQDYNYEVYGVVNHINFRSYGGHYTSHVRALESKEQREEGVWFKCNDSMISHIQSDKEVIPSTAYIFFLKQKKLANQTLIELLKLSKN